MAVQRVDGDSVGLKNNAWQHELFNQNDVDDAFTYWWAFGQATLCVGHENYIFLFTHFRLIHTAIEYVDIYYCSIYVYIRIYVYIP